MHFTSVLASIAALASVAVATIAPTSPVQGTVCIGNVVCTVSWIDDGTSPAASAFGPTEIGLFVGSVDEQTQVQDFGQVDDPSTTTSMDYTIDANAGPDGDFYFVRFQSVSATDDNGTPLQAFSSQFTLAQMTGQLSAEASAEINGSSIAAASSSTQVSSSTQASSEAATSSSSSSSKHTTKHAATSKAKADESVSPEASSSASSDNSVSLGDNPFISGASSLKAGISLAAAAVAAGTWMSLGC